MSCIHGITVGSHCSMCGLVPRDIPRTKTDGGQWLRISVLAFLDREVTAVDVDTCEYRMRGAAHDCLAGLHVEHVDIERLDRAVVALPSEADK